jgi:hypothetical protein
MKPQITISQPQAPRAIFTEAQLAYLRENFRDESVVFTPAQLDFLNRTYTPLQRVMIPAVHTVVIWVLLWVLIAVMMPGLVEVCVGRGVVWQVKRAWEVGWVIVFWWRGGF